MYQEVWAALVVQTDVVPNMAKVFWNCCFAMHKNYFYLNIHRHENVCVGDDIEQGNDIWWPHNPGVRIKH